MPYSLRISKSAPASTHAWCNPWFFSANLTQHWMQTNRSAALIAGPPEAKSLLRRLLLLSCFNPWRDQTNIVDPCLVTKVDDLGNLAEVQILVALDEHNLLLPGREDLRQLRL